MKRTRMLSACTLTVMLMHAVPVHTKAVYNKITKFYHHKGDLGDKIVFYFDKEPVCNRIPYVDAAAGARQKVTFFMPMTHCSAEAKQSMQKLITEKNMAYQVEITQEKKPVPGVKLTIAYVPKKIEYAYDKFQAITGNKGLVFHLYNKDTLRTLQQHDSSILQYAAADKARPLRVALDYGHGGADEGKVGCFGVQEKHINKQVGEKVAQLLRKNGFAVSLTRTGDLTTALDERTTLANKVHADIFLSIHANSAQNVGIQGIETYWLNHQTMCQSCIQPAHIPLQTVVQQYQQLLDTRSNMLANNVHQQVLSAVDARHKAVDRKVRSSVAQVLLGAEMPAVLIEIGFLSNPDNTQLLINDEYQWLVARGIFSGIKNYWQTFYAQAA